MGTSNSVRLSYVTGGPRRSHIRHGGPGAQHGGPLTQSVCLMLQEGHGAVTYGMVGRERCMGDL